MSSTDPPQGESLSERAETLNSNLRRLIEAIAGPLTASGELLRRLRLLLSGAQPTGGLLQPSYEDDAPPLPPDDSAKG